MPTVEELAEAIRELTDDERVRLRVLLDDHYGPEEEAWDRQIEEDIKAGRFDEMVAQALKDDAEGRTIRF